MAENGSAWAGPQAPSIAEHRGDVLKQALTCDLDTGQYLHNINAHGDFLFLWVITVCSHIGLGYGAIWQRLRATLIRFLGNQTVLIAVLHLQLVFINETSVRTELRVAPCQGATQQALGDVVGGSVAPRIHLVWTGKACVWFSTWKMHHRE